MLTEETVSELKRLKSELLSNYNDILINIEQIQNENGVSQITERIIKPFEEIFSIMKRLRTLEVRYENLKAFYQFLVGLQFN